MEKHSMTEQQPVLDVAEIEQLVRQVRGVQAMRVVLDGQGQIEELHVVGTPERSPKSMVRDIESILYVRGRVRLNHRKISLVQVPEHMLLGPGARVQLVSVTRSANDQAPLVTVVLAVGDRRYQGGAGAPGSDLAPEELVAGATVSALGYIAEGLGSFTMERMQRQPLGTLDVCLAHVSLQVEDSLETLLGVSVVRGDALVSAARAVLDAVNRRLPSLLSAQGSKVR